MQNKRRFLLRISLAIALCALATGVFFETALPVIQTSQTLTNAGSVQGVGVGVYWDLACTNKTSSINWGIIAPGSNKTVTVYVRNEGNTAATLSKAVQNWNPSTASSYMTLNWNYAGQTLSVNQVLQVKLNLIVSSTISGITTFSFNITIVASG